MPKGLDPSLGPVRYCPGRPFPRYAYVVGLEPHPLRSPEGHSYNSPADSEEILDPDAWRASSDYLYGIDLFNYGYYWEAHEVWESLWNSAGRYGPTALFLQAIIKLSAAGVKQREGIASPVRRFCAETAAHLLDLRAKTGKDRYAGLDLARVVEMARRALLRAADEPAAEPTIFDEPLLPGDV